MEADFKPNQVAVMIVFNVGTPKEAIRAVVRTVENVADVNIETTQVMGFNASTSYPTLYLP